MSKQFETNKKWNFRSLRFRCMNPFIQMFQHVKGQCNWNSKLFNFYFSNFEYLYLLFAACFHPVVRRFCFWHAVFWYVSIRIHAVADSSMCAAYVSVGSFAVSDKLQTFCLLSIFYFAKNGDNICRFLNYFVYCLISS